MSLRTNGTELMVYIKNAAAMTKKELDTFEELILEGEEVDPRRLRKRIEEAAFLAYALDDKQMVAVGAVKRPADGHKSSIAAGSGVSLNSYRGELGWLFLKPDYRKKHLSPKITPSLPHTFSHPHYSNTRTHQHL